MDMKRIENYMKKYNLKAPTIEDFVISADIPIFNIKQNPIDLTNEVNKILLKRKYAYDAICALICRECGSEIETIFRQCKDYYKYIRVYYNTTDFMKTPKNKVYLYTQIDFRLDLLIKDDYKI